MLSIRAPSLGASPKRIAARCLGSWLLLIMTSTLVVLAGCAPAGESSSPGVRSEAAGSSGNADDLLVVDCLLPGQIRKLGQMMTYLSARRAIKTSASDCEIRGGEYTAYDRANYATALKVWLPLASQGDPEAQTYVGEIYEKGLGTQPDYAMAAIWYRKAADQGYQRAEIDLGHLYEAGLGVPRDTVTAMNWYRRASGLSRANLKFVSDAEVAHQQAQAREVQGLRRQVSSLRRDLETTRRDLAVRKRAADRNQREVEQLRQKLERLQQQPGGSNESSLKRLEQALQQREQELAQQRHAISSLEAQTEGYKTELAGLGTTAKTAQGRAAQLEQELERRSQEVASLRQQLSEAQGRERKAQVQRSQLEQVRGDLEKRLEQASRAKDESLVSKLREELQARQKELDEQVRETARLKGQAEGYRARLAALESSQPPRPPTAGTVAAVEVAGPAIDMIDPPLLATRGIPVVKTRSGIQRLVVGRVTAPAGLLAFTINDKQEQVGKNGLFHSAIPVEASETPVQLVAIDKQGKRAVVEFTFAPEAPQAARQASGQGISELAAAPERLPDINFGRYYALVIGNDSYRSLPHLETPVNDAEAVAKLLSQKYGFEVTLLRNATRYDILSALNKMREQLTDKDNLLIYYAGHGDLDRVNQRGYWLPVDADANNNANWISNVDITDILNAMSAKEVMVIADSCYSGTLTRSALATLDVGVSQEARDRWIQVMAEKRSRTVLTSGGLKPVLDSGGGQHSVFAKAFLDVLAGNRDVLEGQRLFREVSARVTYKAASMGIDEVPEYAPIRFAGHEAGDFFFVPRTT
jgi:Caspase domain/Sel1 repeat